MADCSLRVYISSDVDTVDIVGNLEGIMFLKEKLDRLITLAQHGKSEHFHFMSGDWGGRELDISVEVEGKSNINKLTIYLMSK